MGKCPTSRSDALVSSGVGIENDVCGPLLFPCDERQIGQGSALFLASAGCSNLDFNSPAPAPAPARGNGEQSPPATNSERRNSKSRFLRLDEHNEQRGVTERRVSTPAGSTGAGCHHMRRCICFPASRPNRSRGCRGSIALSLAWSR